MATLGGLLGQLTDLGSTKISSMTASWLTDVVADRFHIKLPRSLALLAAAHLSDSFAGDRTLASLIQPKLGELLPLASKEITQLDAAAVQRIAAVFNYAISVPAAEEIARRIPALAQNPDETVSEFLCGDGLHRIILGSRKPAYGELIRRCPHCNELLLPNVSEEQTA